MVLQNWQQEVEVTKLPKMLQETYTKTLKKSGQKKEVAKYRLSHFPVNSDGKPSTSAIVNDLSNESYQKHAKERYEEKLERKRKEREPIRNKLKALREERNKLKINLRSAESGAKSKVKRLERKRIQAIQLKAEIEALEKAI